jgi:hypothetical protein
MNEDRRKAFMHRINQLVGDHVRGGYMMNVHQRADIGSRILSALEDAYQMGKTEGYSTGISDGAKSVVAHTFRRVSAEREPQNLDPRECPYDHTKLAESTAPERAAERIDPQEP